METRLTYHHRKQTEILNSHDINVRSIDYNHNKPNMLVSGGDDGLVRIWDTRNTKAPLKELSDHSHWYESGLHHPINSISFNF